MREARDPVRVQELLVEADLQHHRVQSDLLWKMIVSNITTLVNFTVAPAGYSVLFRAHTQCAPCFCSTTLVVYCRIGPPLISFYSCSLLTSMLAHPYG